MKIEYFEKKSSTDLLPWPRYWGLVLLIYLYTYLSAPTINFPLVWLWHNFRSCKLYFIWNLLSVWLLKNYFHSNHTKRLATSISNKLMRNFRLWWSLKDNPPSMWRATMCKYSKSKQKPTINCWSSLSRL